MPSSAGNPPKSLSDENPTSIRKRGQWKQSPSAKHQNGVRKNPQEQAFIIMDARRFRFLIKNGKQKSSVLLNSSPRTFFFFPSFFKELHFLNVIWKKSFKTWLSLGHNKVVKRFDIIYSILTLAYTKHLHKYTYTQIYGPIDTNVHRHAHTHNYVYTQICVHICANIRAHTYKYTYIYTQICVHTDIWTQTQKNVNTIE